MRSRRPPRGLKRALDRLVSRFDFESRGASDPVALVHRYSRAEDVEIAALVASSLAYGRADLFRPRIDELLSAMGASPSEFARGFDPVREAGRLSGFAYRFNNATDLALLVSAAGRLQREEGSLGAAFGRVKAEEGALQAALSRFVADLRAAADRSVEAVLGARRGFDHLLPDPLGGSACKRLLLFLRWMVRGPDEIDFGIWPVDESELIIPLDTHVARISRLLRLTARADVSWRTAEEVTASLRAFDPTDPVRYDFALCHLGMSGRCPSREESRECAGCALVEACARRGGCP